MKRLLLFFLMLSFSSCALDYEDNLRSHFTGKLLDHNGNALQDVKVDLMVQTTGFKNSNFSSITGTTSEQNGEFNILTVEPKNKVLYLNFGHFNEEYYLRLKKTGNNQGPLYDLGEMHFNLPAGIQLEFINESSIDSAVYIDFTYTSYVPLDNLPPGWDYDVPNREIESVQIEASQSFTTESQKTIYIKTMFDSDVNIRYSVGTPIQESNNVQEINFNANQSSIQYEIIF